MIMDEKQQPSVIDRHIFVPHYLSVLSNAYTWSQSSHYLKTFNCGINEIRVLTVLAHSPGLSATELCDALAMNKSIVSRSLAELQAKGLIQSQAAGRRQAFRLTTDGLALNAQIVPTALDRERRLLSGFSETDKIVLLGYLARMLQNLENSRAAD